MDGKSIAMEYQRITGNKIYSDHKSIVCNTINKETSLLKEIPEMSQAILLQPGGKMYKKYMEDPKLFTSIGAENVGQLQREFYTLCQDPTKDKFHVLLFAVRLGIADTIQDHMNKQDICNIIGNYLKILEHDI
jgi:hypothetical protein